MIISSHKFNTAFSRFRCRPWKYEIHQYWFQIGNLIELNKMFSKFRGNFLCEKQLWMISRTQVGPQKFDASQLREYMRRVWVYLRDTNEKLSYKM